jgi:IclR family acetate operon transcriptional repressor
MAVKRVKAAGADYQVPMAFRVLKIFEAFQARGPRLFLTEVMELCHIPKASAFRLLETLRSAGYLARDENRRYRLTYKLIEIAAVAQQRDPLRRQALPVMEQLHAELSETINLGILEENQIVYAEVLESPQPLRMVPRIGARACFHATALGKAIATWLPPETIDSLLQNVKLQKFTPKTITTKEAFRRELARIRDLGYAIDDEEETSGCICVAAPVFDGRSRVVCAISASGPGSRMPRSRVAQVGRHVRDACGELSRKLGFRDSTGRGSGKA